MTELRPPFTRGVCALTLKADRAAARAAGPSADEKAAAGGATSGSASRSRDSLQRAHKIESAPIKINLVPPALPRNRDALCYCAGAT